MIWIFINLDGQLSEYSNQENEIFPDRKCHGCCHSPTASRWAGDKGCRRSHSFSLRAAALLLLCCCSEVKPPDFSHSPEGAWWEAVSFLSPQHPLPSPLLRKWCLYPCQKTAALYHKMCVFFFFFMAEPASLKPQHLYWPSSHFSPLSLSLSHPPLFPCLKQYSLPVVIDSRRLGPSKCSFESGVILSNCSNSRWQGWEGFGGL